LTAGELTPAAPAEQRGLPATSGRAVAYCLAAVCLLSLLDAVVKWLTAGYGPPQIAFLRYFVGLGLAVGMTYRRGGLAVLRTRRPFGHALRSALNILTMMIYFTALKLLPLADCVALGFAGPLFMTLLSIPLLGERVGPRRWAALAVGFGGVLLMLQPSGRGFSWAMLLPLASALTYSLGVIASRQLSRTESSTSILFYYSVGVLLVTGAVMPWQWVTPSWADLAIFGLAGVVGSFGQLFLTQAFRYGEVSALAPLEYTALVWAVALGYVVWGELPGWPVLAGTALVIASSLYISHREARQARARRAA
jgi:drug/metabolite transporter (DMT)-like permease